MKKIALYGAGGLGHEVAASIRNGWLTENNFEIIGFFDDRDFSEAQEERLLGPWLGGIEALNAWPEELGVVLCFGDPQARAAVAAKITNPLIYFPNIIQNDFIISDKAGFSIGKGNVITRGCSVSTNITIGNFNLLNGDVAFGHDASVGDANVFMPSCRVSGDVRIGNRNLIGSMSFVKQGIGIGSDVTLSPLSALLTKPKDGNIYIGNPAKIFRF